MGCFFDCFGIRHNHHRHRPRLLSDSSLSTTREELAQKTSLSSLFTTEGREEHVVKDQENIVRRVGWSEIDEELLEEAKFLKACGTLPETPAEIRKAVTLAEKSDKTNVKIPDFDLNSSPETSAEIQQAEDLERTDSHKSHSIQKPSPETPEEIRKAEIIAENLEKSELRRQPGSARKSSPYPTPVRLTDDMQTPGTVFATNIKNLAEGNARIRSQYVITALNPVEKLNQEQNNVREENCVLHEGQSNYEHEGEDLSEEVNATPWMKPPPSNCMKPNIGRIPGDRPIIGLVATHWNEQQEASHISPKWWDGNGIPNSTTKYKEDQKVCWHATPFEERLEKALSEETFVPQRKPISGTPIVFEEMEGHDTATSKLQSINCSKSVVSF